MTKSRTIPWIRGLKGMLVSGLAAVLCSWGWNALRDWADDVAATGGDTIGAGWIESALAGLAGILAMPLLLWAGMRLLGERGNHLLVLLGLVAWWPIGGHVVEDAVGPVATGLFLALFAVIGGLLSLAEMPGKKGTSGTP
ncbi:hypothetical protein [Streptomyces sp. NPDC002851]